MESILILIPIISFLGFYLKGITGTGVSTVIVALGSFVIDPKITVVLASFVNMFGGLSMLRVDPIPVPFRYWFIVAVMMVIGSIVGATMLTVIPAQPFKVFLGSAFLLTSFWFLFGQRGSIDFDQIPTTPSYIDQVVGLIGGICGGFVGVNAPVLVSYFGQRLSKRELRRFLVLIFIPAAIAQTGTFWVQGLLDTYTVKLALLTLPGMVLGIYLGNRAFYRVPEALFRRILGILLLFVSIQLIWKGICK